MSASFEVYLAYLQSTEKTLLLYATTLPSRLNVSFTSKPTLICKFEDFEFYEVYKRISAEEHKKLLDLVEQKHCIIDQIPIDILQKNEFIQIDRDSALYYVRKCLPEAISNLSEQVESYSTNYKSKIISFLESLNVDKRIEFKTKILGQMERCVGLRFTSDYSARLGTIEIRSYISQVLINLKSQKDSFSLEFDRPKALMNAIGSVHVVLCNHEEIVFDKLIFPNSFQKIYKVNKYFNCAEATCFDENGDILDKKYFVYTEKININLNLISGSMREFNDTLTAYFSGNQQHKKALQKAKYIPNGNIPNNQEICLNENTYSDIKEKIRRLLMLSQHNLNGKFFQKTNGKGEAFEWIIDTIIGSNDCIIIDTFFDSKAAIQLLKRISKPINLTIITGHESPDSINSLVESLEAERKFFQCSITVYNLTKQNGNQLFHDRFIITDTYQVYLLSNSFSTYAENAPFTLMPLDQETGSKVVYYYTEVVKNPSRYHHKEIWSTKKSIRVKSHLQKNSKFSIKTNVIDPNKLFNPHNLRSIFGGIQSHISISLKEFRKFVFWFLNKKDFNAVRYSHFLLFCGEIFARVSPQQMLRKIILNSVKQLSMTQKNQVLRYTLNLYHNNLLQIDQYQEQEQDNFSKLYNAIKGNIQIHYNGYLSGLYGLIFLIHDLLVTMPIRRLPDLPRHKELIARVLINSIHYMDCNAEELNHLINNLVKSKYQFLQIAALAIIELNLFSPYIDSDIFVSIFLSENIPLNLKILSLAKYYDNRQVVNLPKRLHWIKIAIVKKLSVADISEIFINELYTVLRSNHKLIDLFLTGIDTKSPLYDRLISKSIDELAKLYNWTESITPDLPVFVHVDINQIEFYANHLAKLHPIVSTKSKRWGRFFNEALNRIKTPLYTFNLENTANSTLILILLISKSLSIVDLNLGDNEKTLDFLVNGFNSIIFSEKFNGVFREQLLINQVMYYIVHNITNLSDSAEIRENIFNSITDYNLTKPATKIQEIYLMFLDTIKNKIDRDKFVNHLKNFVILCNDDSDSVFLINYIKLIVEFLLKQGASKQTMKRYFLLFKHIISATNNFTNLVGFPCKYFDLLTGVT